MPDRIPKDVKELVTMLTEIPENKREYIRGYAAGLLDGDKQDDDKRKDV